MTGKLIFKVFRGTTALYRAVRTAELNDLLARGAFHNPLGIEVKYFSETAEGAASYAQQAQTAFGEGPYTIVKTKISSQFITPEMRATVDRCIPIVVVPTELLPQLAPPKILP